MADRKSERRRTPKNRQTLWRRILLRPSYWVALASILVYWDEKALHGEFVYDDDGSIRANPVVNGKAPWTDAFRRDFWGTPMTNIQSHKSFRPITTLSFKLNWILFPPANQDKNLVPGADRTVGTYSFHVANVLLHGMVSGLVTEAAAFVFHAKRTEDLIAQITTGFLFGLHPVHSEAVSNVTSRGELFMSLFFLLSFLSFASQIHSLTVNQTAPRGFISFLAIYIIPWLCMTLSLFSKEQGGATLISLVVYDFLRNHFSVVDLFRSILRRKSQAVAFVRRTVVLAVETLLVCGWRYWLNGETKPDFVFDQNPAGFAPDRFTRAFSVTWVYCLYIWDALYPRYLTVDWSGKSIPLITDLNDPRAALVIVLWCFAFLCLISTIFGLPSRSEAVRYYRTSTLISFVAFLFCPFLLSSNILVVVGLMKADRVIYLPLMGFCLMEAQLVRYACSLPSSSRRGSKQIGMQVFHLEKICHAAILIQMLLFCRKVHERNHAWANGTTLWTAAYNVNPRSHHTIYNCGYNLSLQGRYEEAERVLHEIGHPDVDGPTTTFVYVMVLQNLGRCKEALPLIDRAMDVLAEQKRKGGVRYTDESIQRAKSNLLVATGFCTSDLGERANYMLKAVETDPLNDYAVQSATALNEFMKKMTDKQALAHILKENR
ncbi:hypothetical protein ACA910_010762 [Epithemia clementina (nom. ined.)]